MQDFLVGLLERAIGLGADEVRADLPQFLFRRFNDKPENEPLAKIIKRAKEYAQALKVDLKFNAETYAWEGGNRWQQERMVQTGADKVYSDGFFNAFWKIAREGASADILDGPVGEALFGALSLWIYASNFDQVTLKAMGGSPEAMAILCLAMSHLRPEGGSHPSVVFSIDWDDLFLFWGRAIRVPGGGNGRVVNGPHVHLFSPTKEELDFQVDNPKQTLEFHSQPVVQAIKDFAKAVPKSGELFVDWDGRDSEDRSRFYSLSWEIEPGEWAMMVLDLKPALGARDIWARAPEQVKEGFKVFDPLNREEKLEIAPPGNPDPSYPHPRVTGIAFKPGVAYRILRLSHKPARLSTDADTTIRSARSSSGPPEHRWDHGRPGMRPDDPEFPTSSERPGSSDSSAGGESQVSSRLSGQIEKLQNLKRRREKLCAQLVESDKRVREISDEFRKSLLPTTVLKSWSSVAHSARDLWNFFIGNRVLGLLGESTQTIVAPIDSVDELKSLLETFETTLAACEDLSGELVILILDGGEQLLEAVRESERAPHGWPHEQVPVSEVARKFLGEIASEKPDQAALGELFERVLKSLSPNSDENIFDAFGAERAGVSNVLIPGALLMEVNTGVVRFLRILEISVDNTTWKTETLYEQILGSIPSFFPENVHLPVSPGPVLPEHLKRGIIRMLGSA